VLSGSVALVAELKPSRGEVIDQVDADGNTALHHAASVLDLELLKVSPRARYALLRSSPPSLSTRVPRRAVLGPSLLAFDRRIAGDDQRGIHLLAQVCRALGRGPISGSPPEQHGCVWLPVVSSKRADPSLS
jgi:hypothetical protein